MATVVKAANAHTAITTGWTNPSNAFATTTDSSFATAAPGKNSTVNGDFGFPDFSSSDIPDGATINSVTITVNWGMTASVTGGILGVQLRDNGSGLGTETTQTVTTQQNATQVVNSGVSLADLRSASSLIKARVRCSKGNSSSSMTGNLDFVSITVSYTPAAPQSRSAPPEQRRRRRLLSFRQRAALVTTAALVPAFGTLGATLTQAFPLSLSATASVGDHATFNQAIPLTLSGTATSGGSSYRKPHSVVVHRRVPHARRRGMQATSTMAPVFVLHASFTQVIPLSLSATATATSGSAIRPTVKPVRIKQAKRPRRGGRIDVTGFVQPATALSATFNKAFPLTLSGSVDVPPPMAPSAGTVVVRRNPLRPFRGRVVSRRAPLHVGPVLSFNQPLPLVLTGQATTQHAVSFNQPFPLALVAAASVANRLTCNQAVPLTLAAAASTSNRLTFNQPFPLTLAGSAAVGTFRSATLNQPVPLVLAGVASANVDLSFSQAVPLVASGTASVRVDLAFDNRLPLVLAGTMVGPIGAIVPAPTAVDVETLPTTADVLAVIASGDLVSATTSADLTAHKTGLTILSSESEDMPNLVHFIKQGDTAPPLVATLGSLNDDGTITPDNLTGCTVTVNIRLGGLIVSGGSVTVLDAVNGQVQYNFASGDTAKAGDAQAEFKSVDGSGKVKRYPDSTNFVIKITPQVGP